MILQNLGEYIREKKKLGNKLLIIDPEKEKTYSYFEMITLSESVAAFLDEKGIQQNDKVACISTNRPEMIILFFGCLIRGAIFHPINPGLSSDEMTYVLDNSDSVIAFCEHDSEEKVKSLALPTLNGLFRIDELMTFPEKSVSFQNVKLDDNAVLMYSSGTTGFPKGIVLTQRNLLVECESIARILHFSEHTRGIEMLPLFFSGGLFPNVFTIFLASGSIVLPRKFSKSQFWNHVKKYNVTWSFGVPTMLAYLLNPPENISSQEISSFQFMSTGAAPLPIEIANNFEKHFGKKVVEAYGLTENVAWTTVNDPKSPRYGSIGKPIDIAVMKVIDENGNEVLDGIEGQILIKGPHVFKEYYKNQEATQKTLIDGWLHSGDRGYRNNEGYYFITGRIKEIIKKGGVLISPVAIDTVFYKHPAVKDAATVGIPDHLYGEEIVTFVSLKEGMNATEDEFFKLCEESLEKFKCPKEIFFIEEIPKGPSGKLLRRELLRKYSNKFEK